MKIIFLIIAVVILGLNAWAQTVQTYELDSLKEVLSTNLSDTNRIWALNNLGRNIHDSDSTLLLANQAIELSRRIGFVKGEAEAYNNIGLWFNQKGNYPRALEGYLKAIQLAETINFEGSLKRSFNSISTVYLYMKDYRTCISYAQKARTLSLKLKDESIVVFSSSWLSSAYLRLDKLDSASYFARESYRIARELNEHFPLYLSSSRLAEIHLAKDELSEALDYLRLSLGHSKLDGRSFRIAGVYQQLASVFKALGQRDSCEWYALQAYDLSQRKSLPATSLSSSLMLSELYEDTDKASSLKYRKLAMIAQDSLFSQEKSRQVESLSMNERLRQRELEVARLQAEEERRHNLQYAGIALGFVLLVIVFLAVSHSVNANESIIKFLGVLALLILFEFVNLLIHPLLGNVTHHSPLLMLGAMVCIAGLLVPLHHQLEKAVVHRLIEKNKNIRLSAKEKADPASVKEIEE
jgi:tetratricopeptide (TPR) repeat protein